MADELQEIDHDDEQLVVSTVGNSLGQSAREDVDLFRTIKQVTPGRIEQRPRVRYSMVNEKLLDITRERRLVSTEERNAARSEIEVGRENRRKQLPAWS